MAAAIDDSDNIIKDYLKGLHGPSDRKQLGGQSEVNRRSIGSQKPPSPGSWVSSRKWRDGSGAVFQSDEIYAIHVMYAPFRPYPIPYYRLELATIATVA